MRGGRRMSGVKGRRLFLEIAKKEGGKEDWP